MKSNNLILALGIVVSAGFAIILPWLVTWPMAATAILMMCCADKALDEASGKTHFDQAVGYIFEGMVIVLAMMSWEHGNWWILLRFGVSGLLGLVYPGVIHDASEGWPTLRRVTASIRLTPEARN